MLEPREIVAERERTNALRKYIIELEKAIDNIRDAVLHERFQMAEMDFGPDRVNAVLGIIDDHDPRPLQQKV